MSDEGMAALDRYIAPGLRFWMLIALVSGVLLIMVVIVCCFMKIRIPRTKRQIDLIAAKRKLRKQGKKLKGKGATALKEHQPDEPPRNQTIVLNSLTNTRAAATINDASKNDTRLLIEPEKTNSQQTTSV